MILMFPAKCKKILLKIFNTIKKNKGNEEFCHDDF